MVTVCMHHYKLMNSLSLYKCFSDYATARTQIQDAYLCKYVAPAQRVTNETSRDDWSNDDNNIKDCEENNERSYTYKEG